MEKRVYESPRMEIIPLETGSLLVGSSHDDFSVNEEIVIGTDDVWQ